MGYRHSNTSILKMKGPRKPSLVHTMTPAEAAWVGAMLEGEGSVLRSPKDNSIQVTIYNTEVETMATLLRFIGDGKVYMQALTPRHKKGPVWFYSLAKQAAVVDLLQQVECWLTGKKDKAQRALRALGEEMS